MTKKIASYSLSDDYLDLITEISGELDVNKSELIEMSLDSFCKHDLQAERKIRITELTIARKKIREALRNPPKSMTGILISHDCKTAK